MTEVPTARYKALVDVHVLLLRDDALLLLRRAHTGFADGQWQPPAGHLEAGESVLAAAREAREEVGVRIDPAALRFGHVCHHRSAEGRVGFFFVAREWAGEPYNAEPHKHDAVEWFPLAALPSDLVDYCATGVAGALAGVGFGLHGWPDGG
ncbi:NUDIX domain-containing protein [Marinactinospora rubrisoli]|uniref:NUDIX domain-containing protein n=1 Tax=Marinactinospora rubrisoli TaxID=2715399 RepID=A0ABW2K8N4_9ACTN